MTWLPFEPQREEPAPAPEADADRPLTVGELAELIKAALEGHVRSPLAVIGEISNLSTPNHWYFSLKDDLAVVSCVAWASSARTFGFRPADGAEVVATGYVSHYGPQGRTQLYVRHMRPVGAGALDLKFKALCAELRRLGYFDEARKKALPLLPRRIAVITSAAGAAVHDVVATAGQRCRAVGLLLVDVRVQGDGAARQIAAAIRRLDSRRVELRLDAILVTRGGGSAEDLGAFNERVVADAVFECRLPVVAAIGHESDTTIVELVADVRAATPTQATMRVVPDARQLGDQVGHLAHRLAMLLRRRLGAERQRLDSLGRAASHLGPAAAMRAARSRLAEVRRRLDRAIEGRVRRGGEALAALARQLAALDPSRVVARGYSITTASDGRLVRSIEDVRAGDSIETRVADGSIESVVTVDRRKAFE